MIVDRNRQKFIQRYLVTSAIPIRRSFSLSSFDYANVIADTLQYAEDDRQSLNSVTQSYGDTRGGGDNGLFDEYELGAAISAVVHESVLTSSQVISSKYSTSPSSPSQNSHYLYPPPPPHAISPPHPPPFPHFSTDSVDYLDQTSNSPLTPLTSSHRPYLMTSNVSQRSLCCHICDMNEPNACFMSCGHGGICYSCAILIIKRYTNQCPFCRIEISNLFKISKRYSYTMAGKFYQFGVCHEGFQIERALKKRESE
jgi:hypothetical protein